MKGTKEKEEINIDENQITKIENGEIENSESVIQIGDVIEIIGMIDMMIEIIEIGSMKENGIIDLIDID